MAKKRKYTKSNSRGNTRKSKHMSNIDLTICILIVLSILLGFLIYTNSGVIGVKLNEILGGMMGVTRLLLPIGILGVAIKLACTDNEYVSSKLIKFCVLLISISVIMCVIQISSGELIPSKEISESLKDAYYNGSQGKGGGALGALLAIPMAKLIGNIGTIIVCMGIAIILAATTFGVNVSELINMIVEKHQEKQENKKEEKLHEKESRMQERENRELERAKAKQEARLKKQKQENNPDEQIQINFGGHIIEEESPKKLKKFKHDKDDLIPLGMEKTKKPEPDVIENNLFKQEEEQKQDKTKEVLQLEHTITVEDENYEYPPVELLSKGKKASRGSAKMLADTAAKLQKTLYSFGVSAKVENVSVGPTITRYELKPAEGTRVSKIANLADDIALNLAAETIRIEAPIPGKQAVGIEVPNKEKEAVHLREVIESSEFENNKSKLSVALGKDVAGKTIIADIGKMPHVLIAGSTGSGKSVCINSIITSIIYNAKPSEVKLVMVDPKVVELSVYNGIPHLLIPVVTDPKKAAGALAWAVQEMDDRYNKFAQKGVRDLKGYNKAIEKENENAKLPQIVIIIDELADLMMVAAKEVEEAICRLAQKARAAGMHLVIATQRPSVDVITGLIKANVPSRIAFAVSSQVDSRTILDSTGAEKLLGKGDMLFYPVGASKPLRVQGAFVSDDEVEKIVDFIKMNAGEVSYSEDIIESIEKSNKSDKELLESEACEDDSDPFLQDAIETVIETGQASTSFIQRRFKVGYARAGRIIDQMEERGIISGYQGSKPREVLMSKEKWEELKMQTSKND